MKGKKYITLMLLLSSLVGCGGEVSNSSNSMSSDSSTISTSTEENNEVTYEVYVKNVYGTYLRDVVVQIYKDNKVVFKEKTDYYGKVVASLVEDSYQVKLSDLPKGMYLDEMVSISHEVSNEVICYASPIEESLPGNYYYKIGDLMYDFTVVNTDSERIKLSTLLETKKAVMINFWASWCEPCHEEFSYINQAYESYKDDIEVIALSVETSDSLDYIKELKEDLGLSFTMGRDLNRLLLWSFIRYFGDAASGQYSVPGTVYIDKYGFINKIVSLSYVSYDELVTDFEYIINRYN